MKLCDEMCSVEHMVPWNIPYFADILLTLQGSLKYTYFLIDVWQIHNLRLLVQLNIVENNTLAQTSNISIIMLQIWIK